MKVLLAVLIMCVLSACGSVSVKTPDGLDFQSRTLWKDVQAFECVKEADGSMLCTLGSSQSAQDAKALLLVCLLMPDTPGCGEG